MTTGTSDRNDLRDAPDAQSLAAQAAEKVAALTGVARHDLALVLGSGWGGAAELIGPTVATIPAEELPGFRPSGIPGHSGTIRSVQVAGTDVHVLVIGARTHLYEERGVDAVAHPIRVAAATGVHTLVLTNGCGGLDPQILPGTPVILRDHINLTGASPLHGATFVDLTEAYSARLRALAQQVDPTLSEGVYAQFRGPQYETPAEVRMAGVLGATLVGMSTTLETIAARSLGLEVLGLSLVTNLAAGIGAGTLSHAEVTAAGQAAGPRISELLARIVARIAAEESGR